MISIIIPLYNEEKNIEQLWRSLMRIEPSEIILVDGGSEDATVKRLRELIGENASCLKETAAAEEADRREGSSGIAEEATGEINTTEQDEMLPANENADCEARISEPDGEVAGEMDSADWTALSNGHRALLLLSPERGRANQMNYGAGFASGDLFFLHADSLVPSTAISDIESVLQRHSAGCFRLRFAPSSFLLFCCGRLSGFRVISRRILFGDQGIFIRRELFDRLGGYAKLPLMEDYELSIRLKQKGISIGMTKSVLITSSRRFTDNGTIRTMIKMQKLQRAFRKGVDAKEIARQYK